MSVFQVVPLQRHQGQEVRNVLYYQSDALTLEGNDLQAFADAFRTAWGVGMVASNWATNWSMYGLNVRRVDAGGAPSIDVGFTSGVFTGTSSSDPLPTQIALLVHGVRYDSKPNRVRTYVAGRTEGQITAGLWASTILSQALTWAQSIHEINATPGDFIRVAAQWNEDHSLVVQSGAIEAYFVSQVPATQRRRRIGRGS